MSNRNSRFKRQDPVPMDREEGWTAAFREWTLWGVRVLGEILRVVAGFYHPKPHHP